DRIVRDGGIFFGISDRDWILEGAAVHVSLVGFDDGIDTERTLDGTKVDVINPDLTANADVTKASKLRENAKRSFIGIQKSGPFDIPWERALELLGAPSFGGVHASDVLRPYRNAEDLTQRTQETWIIDFDEMTEREASFYEGPFEHVKANVKP